MPYGPSRRRSASLALVGLLAASVPAGAILFLDLVLSRGDVYPPYSSFRSDPLGTRALYEALEGQPGLEVRRLLGPLPSGEAAGRAVVLAAGLPAEALEEATREDVEEAEAFLRAGGRLVLALRPESGAAEREAPREERPHPESAPRIPARWGVAFRPAAGAPVVAARREAGAAVSGLSLPAALSWRSGLRLDLRASGWTPLYSVDGAAVAAARPFGRGTLVLLTDASLLTNEAMRKERASAFLAFLAGDKTTVLFDETHLGVEEQEGVMTLVRRYRLGGVLLAALLVAGLFAWRSVTGLLPQRDDLAAVPRASGRDSFEGLVRLLARGIPPARLLPAALGEWSKTSGEPTEEMRRLAAEARRAADVPAAYAALCRAAHPLAIDRKEPDA